ncbi:DUF4469 domain-containing protein [Aliifodinibius sp. S!AR15-10]|uniref:DNA-binding domain-containing protein n=1 Tax=Aliifodinibius sp. S!AR15-10 TaxID=2950437 RepID=UPI00285659C2|nr:DNA-binding domain-containing protein [Aliifodinibius sp. S!AR15-10]MDR8391644.1 DUF4469 domain-containing protein [Aliifodinibius sp. S!AR15-10]
MSISYSLYENHLTENSNDYLARVRDQASHNIEEIVDIMATKGSTVTRADTLSVLEEFEAAIAQILLRGGSINTPLFRINGSISGIFTGPSDSFDPKRHEVKLNVNPGMRVKRIAERISVEKVSPESPKPKLLRYQDNGSDTTNETLSPGRTGLLVGELLKLDPEDPDQGLFLVASDGAETKIEEFVENRPSKLGFLVPEGLASGEYTMEVRATVYDSKEIRTGTLDATLTIA